MPRAQCSLSGTSESAPHPDHEVILISTAQLIENLTKAPFEVNLLREVTDFHPLRMPRSVESRIELRNIGLATIAFLPLVVVLLSGASSLAPLALFPAAVVVFHFAFGRLEKTGWPLFGGMEPGIRVRTLGLAIFAFLPIWLQPHPPWSSTLALFAASVAALYFVLRLLEKAGWAAFGIAASLAAVFAALNLVYLHLVGRWVGYQVFASVLETNRHEILGSLSDPFMRRYGLRVAVLLTVVFGLS